MNNLMYNYVVRWGVRFCAHTFTFLCFVLIITSFEASSQTLEAEIDTCRDAEGFVNHLCYEKAKEKWDEIKRKWHATAPDMTVWPETTAYQPRMTPAPPSKITKWEDVVKRSDYVLTFLEIFLPFLPFDEGAEMVERSKREWMRDNPGKKTIKDFYIRRELPPGNEMVGWDWKATKRIKRVSGHTGRRLSTGEWEWEEIAEEGEYEIWKAEVTSLGAIKIQLAMEDVRLPDGSFLYFYSPYKEIDYVNAEFKGPYSAAKLESPAVFGDSVHLEYHVPVGSAWPNDEPIMKITGVMHLPGSLKFLKEYPFLEPTRRSAAQLAIEEGQSGIAEAMQIREACYEPVSALEHNQMEVGNSVVYIEFGSVEACTGVLLNNISHDHSPIVLTAKHCIEKLESGLVNPMDVRIHWNYVDANSMDKPELWSDGVEILASGDGERSSDYAILRVIGETPMNPLFAGWSGMALSDGCVNGDAKKTTVSGPDGNYDIYQNCKEKSGSPVFSIHHPMKSPQRSSQGAKVNLDIDFNNDGKDDYPDNRAGGAGQTDILFGAQRELDKYHSIQMKKGATNEGSSGAPLYYTYGNGANVVVGHHASARFGFDCVMDDGFYKGHTYAGKFTETYTHLLNTKGPGANNPLKNGLFDDVYKGNHTQATQKVVDAVVGAKLDKMSLDGAEAGKAINSLVIKNGVDDHWGLPVKKGHALDIKVNYVDYRGNVDIVLLNAKGEEIIRSEKDESNYSAEGKPNMNIVTDIISYANSTCEDQIVTLKVYLAKGLRNDYTLSVGEFDAGSSSPVNLRATDGGYINPVGNRVEERSIGVSWELCAGASTAKKPDKYYIYRAKSPSVPKENDKPIGTAAEAFYVDSDPLLIGKSEYYNYSIRSEYAIAGGKLMLSPLGKPDKGYICDYIHTAYNNRLKFAATGDLEMPIGVSPETGNGFPAKKCKWDVFITVNTPWLTLKNYAIKEGLGSVGLSAMVNSEQKVRSSYINVAGQVIQVDQAGIGTVMRPGKAVYDWQGGQGYIYALTPKVVWGEEILDTVGAYSVDPWIKGDYIDVSNKIIFYVVDINYEKEGRVGVIVVGDLTFPVFQNGNNCLFTMGKFGAIHSSEVANGSTELSTSQECFWVPTTIDDWITIDNVNSAGVSGGLQNGNGVVKYTLAANTTSLPRKGAISIGGKSFAITQMGAVCDTKLTPSTASFATGGGKGSFAVSASADCQWAPMTADSWITIDNPNMVTGPGEVRFTVAENAGGKPRTGSITAGSSTFTVSQIQMGVTPTSRIHGSGAEFGSVKVAAPVGSAWSALSGATWIKIVNGQGSGAGQMDYRLEPNPAQAQRTGYLTIGGVNFTVTQMGSECAYTITPLDMVHNSGKETGLVKVQAPANCAWTAASLADWITITSADGGSGNGEVAYSVGANAATTSRKGTLSIAGLGYLARQNGADCATSVSMTFSKNYFTWEKTTATIDVTTGAGCYWRPIADVNWIVFDMATQLGSGKVTFTVGANESRNPRFGGVMVMGKTEKITQEEQICSYVISPQALSLGAAEAPVAVTVTTPWFCSWTATTADPWIAIGFGASMSGPGEVRYTAQANLNVAQRTGTIKIQDSVLPTFGGTHSVTQASATCATTTLLQPDMGAHGDQASTSGLLAITTPAFCAWTAASSAPWLTVTAPGAGSGSGTIGYSVSANATGAARSGSITVSGQTFTLTQNGAACP